MNSWMSRPLSAWAPPLSTFIMRHGQDPRARPAEVLVERQARTRRRAARATASETPSSALAPSPDLLGVPSSSSSARSISRLLGRLEPLDLGRDHLVHVAHAPGARPCRRSGSSSSSRSSTASRVPVEAPDGTMARPKAPDSSQTSTSMVGLPRESRISRAWTVRISGHGSGLSFTMKRPRARSGSARGAERGRARRARRAIESAARGAARRRGRGAAG